MTHRKKSVALHSATAVRCPPGPQAKGIQNSHVHLRGAHKTEQHGGRNAPRRCRQSSLNPPVQTSPHTATSVKAAKASDTPRDTSLVVGSLISCGLPSLGNRGVRPSSSMDIMHADIFVLALPWSGWKPHHTYSKRLQGAKSKFRQSNLPPSRLDRRLEPL